MQRQKIKAEATTKAKPCYAVTRGEVKVFSKKLWCNAKTSAILAEYGGIIGALN